MTIPTQTDPSSIIDGVAEQFMQFLTSFTPHDQEPPAAEPGDEDAPASYMASKVQEMATANDTVLYIEYKHISEFNYDLADRIVSNYERVEPILRDTLKAFMRQHHEQFIREAHGPEKEFFVGIHDLLSIDRLRDLRTEHIGKLSAFSGTITRTSDVRPELFLGTFRCQQCGTEVRNVEQFYKFTEPIVCPNQACNNK
jgi:DNA replication licensing factor MCM6